MGLIDERQPTAAPAPTPDQSTGNPIDVLRQKAEALVQGDSADAVQRIVLAGKKILYSPESHKMVEETLKGDNPAAAAGEGVAELMGILAHESRGTLPQKAVNPSMMILLAETLDYLKQTNRIAGTNEDIETAGKALSDALLKASKVSPDMFDQIMQRTQQAMQDPKMAAQLQQHAQGG